MFENKLDKVYGIPYTRYIASWIRVDGPLIFRVGKKNSPFYRWLISIGVDPEDAGAIWELASNGKLELQDSAAEFLRKEGFYEA